LWIGAVVALVVVSIMLAYIHWSRR
jgi:hypothetical protein